MAPRKTKKKPAARKAPAKKKAPPKRAKTAKNPNGAGAPKKTVEPDEIRKLASLGCTFEEMAGFLGIHRDTLRARLKEPDCAEAFDAGSANVKISLRRAQIETALAGNVTAQIWLGKQLLEQRDTRHLAGHDGGPVEIITDPRDRLREKYAEIARRIDSAESKGDG